MISGQAIIPLSRFLKWTEEAGFGMVGIVRDPVVGNRDSCRSIRGRTRRTTALVAIGDDEDSSEADTMHWAAKKSLSGDTAYFFSYHWLGLYRLT